MEKLLPWLNAISITSALGLFLWWKSTLHKELVQPPIDTVNQRIEFLDDRVVKFESLFERNQESQEHKLDKIQDNIAELTKAVAELSGQVKAMQK